MELGLERFVKSEHKKFKKLRLGVVCNQASLDRNRRHVSELVLQAKLPVTCFFGPQHGIRGEKQYNMIESDDFLDPTTGLPVYSLYGKMREPSDAALAKIDAFVVDLQDIGTRIYTYQYTMANCMRAAKRAGKKVIVLDRPNPIGGATVEGNVLEKGFESFVGQFPLPVRPALTLGELALLFNEAYGIGCDLEIVKLKGWKRETYAPEWRRDWAPPSPQIPTFDSALVFPGTVLFEGTNVSEGRGTTRPFEWIGAPYIEPDRLATEMNRQKIPGVYFRPIFFQPVINKWKDEVCGGVQLHVTDRGKFRPFTAGVRLVAKIAELHPKEFAWEKPPYEYEYDRPPIDFIAGTDKLRALVDKNESTKAFERHASQEAAAFRKQAREFRLY